MNKKVVKSENNIKDIFFKYMLPNAIFKVTIVPVIFLLFLSAQFHNIIIDCINSLERYLAYSVKSSYPSTLVIRFLLNTLVHYILAFIAECLFSIYLQNTVKMAFKLHTKEYMMINYSDYHRLGNGRIHSLIERRTVGAIDLINLIIMNIFQSFCYIITTNYELKKSFGNEILWANLFIFSFYTIFCLMISYLLEKRRRIANYNYNIASNRIYCILKNYDVIKSFNNDHLELIKLNRKLDDVERTYFMYEFISNLTRFIQHMIIVLPNSYILYLAITGKGFSTIATFANLSLYNKRFLSIKCKMDNIGTEILKYIQSSTNVRDSQIEGVYLDDNEKGINIEKLESTIEFKNVSIKIFDNILVKDINLKIYKGEKIAIVGKNGSGKSTLMKTLLRFYDHDGIISIDEVDTNEINVKSQRNIISYIPQNPYINEGTVLENLKYTNKNLDNATIRSVCKKFGTHEIFTNLEKGYLTNVGESGKFLSGGQKQQISFMRGVLKDGDIFLIDEATANLDHLSEKETMNKIFNKLVDKTVLIILHNFEFLSKFDKIIGFVDKEMRLYESYEDFEKDMHLF